MLSTLRILSKNTKFRFVTSSLYHLQQIIIPSLLILHLSVFSPPTSTYTNSFGTSSHIDKDSTTPHLKSEVIQVWLAVIEPWRWFVKNATPLFTTLEGFCTLLVLQTLGRLSSWLVRTKSDSWMIAQLLASSCTISSSLYFLYRIYTFPVSISLVSASLIGVVLTIAAFISLYGIVSGRGNTVESSLLFAYIVYCLYFTFTDFQSSISASSFLYFFSSSSRPDIPPLPPIIINGYTNLVATVAALVPASFKTVFQFLQGAVSTVTPSVFVSLSYRLTVFFAATRIVPAVHDVSHSRRNSASSISAMDIDEVVKSEAGYRKNNDEDALDEDDREEEYEDLVGGGDDDDEVTVTHDESCNEKYSLSASSLSSASTLAVSSPNPNSLPEVKTHTIQILILSYAPCILIAVYTHLLIQHLSLFNTFNSGNDPASSTIASPSPSSSPIAYTYTQQQTHNITSQPTTNTSSLYSLQNATENLVASAITSATTHVCWTWSQGWTNPRDSWMFWGWVNMFTTLFLYALELIYGKENNKEEIIEQHWKTD